MIILFLKRAKHHCNTCCHFAYCPARKCDIAVGWRLHFSTQCDKKEGERYNNYLILHNIIPEQYFTGNFSFSFNLLLHYYTCLTWPALHKKWSFPIIKFWISSCLLKKSLMENFNFCAVQLIFMAKFTILKANRMCFP